MQGDMPGQAVESLHEVEEGVEPALRGESAKTRGAQLGQVGEGIAGITGTDVREGLGEGAVEGCG